LPDAFRYNGEPFSVADEGYTNFYNKPCGGFTLVQHRVKEYDSKHYTPPFRSLYPTVWPDLDKESSTSKPIGGIGRGDSRKPFGPHYDPHKFRWQEDEAGEYDGGGFMVHFPSNTKKVCR